MWSLYHLDIGTPFGDPLVISVLSRAGPDGVVSGARVEALPHPERCTPGLAVSLISVLLLCLGIVPFTPARDNLCFHTQG